MVIWFRRAFTIFFLIHSISHAQSFAPRSCLSRPCWYHYFIRTARRLDLLEAKKMPRANSSSSDYDVKHPYILNTARCLSSDHIVVRLACASVYSRFSSHQSTSPPHRQRTTLPPRYLSTLLDHFSRSPLIFRYVPLVSQLETPAWKRCVSTLAVTRDSRHRPTSPIRTRGPGVDIKLSRLLQPSFFSPPTSNNIL
jgi:hypothetical protein